MSYGAGAVSIVVLFLAVLIWNRVWREIGPDGKPIFAALTLAVIVVMVAGLLAWLTFRT